MLALSAAPIHRGAPLKRNKSIEVLLAMQLFFIIAKVMLLVVGQRSSPILSVTQISAEGFD